MNFDHWAGRSRAGLQRHGPGLGPGARADRGARVSPREVFERLVDGVTHGHWDTLPELYAEDADVIGAERAATLALVRAMM